MMHIDEFWKRGFWFWIKSPLYFVYEALGITSSWDKYNLLKFGVSVSNKFDELEKRIEVLEKRRNKK